MQICPIPLSLIVGVHKTRVDFTAVLTCCVYLYQQRMSLHRTMTMDATTMKERLHRTSSSSSTGGGVTNLNDITELSESFSPEKPIVKSNAEENEEIKKLNEELAEVKEKLIEMTDVKPTFASY